MEDSLWGKKLIAYLVAFTVTSTQYYTYSQSAAFRFENITSNEGLADRTIYAITQDAQGFIWIGSGEGLTRYDGYSCVVYRHESGKPQSLSDNEIYALCTDGEGTLWIGTRHGLNRYDVQNDRFESFFHDSKDDNSVSGNEIFALAKDPGGNLWIGTYGGGLDKMIKKKGAADNKSGAYKFIHYRHDKQDSGSISSNQIFSVCFDRQGQAWVGTSKGLNVLQAGTNKFTRFYQLPGNKNSISNNTVNKVFIDREGAVWIFGKGMLDKIKRKKSPWQYGIVVQHFLPLISGHSKLNNWVINDFVIDRDGNAWMATNDFGLYKFVIGQNGEVSSCEHFVNSPKISQSLVSSTTYCLFEERSGVIWIGTATGVSKYIPSKARFNEAKGWDELLPTNKGPVRALLADSKNRLWFTYSTDTLYVLGRGEGSTAVQTFSLPRSGKGMDQVNVLYQSRAGDIYIGTLLQGLFIIPRSLRNIQDRRKWISITSDQHYALSSNNIYCVTEDSSGMIWIGTYKGLSMYDPVNRKMRSVYASPNGTVVSSYIVRSVCVDENNTVWCGTDDGVILTKEGTEIRSFKNTGKDSTSISHNGITACYMDAKKNIWIGTKEGLNRYNPLYHNFKRFTVQSGLPNGGIRSLQEDAKGNLWIGTNHGLLKLDPLAQKVNTYGMADGLVSDQFVRNAVCRDSAGIFYFGTGNGIVSFRPANIAANKYLPPVVITDIKIFNKSLSSLADTNLIVRYRRENKLVLKYNENFFSFEFAALNYIHSAANQYAYMLEGVDRQWNHMGSQRFAGYTDIAPGHYTFKVMASNNDGEWNKVPAAVAVIIVPPWWRTWWFYLLCFMAACVVFYSIYRIRLRQLLKVYRLRSSIAKDLHDDVGSALSSISLLSSIAQEGRTNARLKPEEILSRIGDTSRQMIELMDDIVWAVNPANDRFGNMLIRMREYAAEMLEAKNIAFTFDVPEDVGNIKIPMHMRKDYFLIFKETVNNLSKYAMCSHAVILIERANRTIVTTVSDNGKGFDPQIICSGNGLKNMQERAKAIRGEFRIETGPGRGTKVMLTVRVT